MIIQHFLSLNDFSKETIICLLERANFLKNQYRAGVSIETLKGKVLAMIFEKASTRTRVSFEAAMNQLGGNAIFLNSTDSQLSRGETPEDTARVISQMVDAIMIRTSFHKKIELMAENSQKPVINGLSDTGHPCQLLADLMMIQKAFGTLDEIKVAWIGDGNNVCQSYCEAAKIFGFQLDIACPEGFEPDLTAVGTCKNIKILRVPKEAVINANVVTTDVFTSMGHEGEADHRQLALLPYQVTPTLLDCARPSVIFLHCLPAHRGEEISDDLFDDVRTLSVWEQAGNRLHAQKALLERLILG